MPDSRPDTYRHKADVAALLLGVVGDLTHRALVHDNSKLVEPELAIFDEYTQRLKDTTYGSPEYKAQLEEMQVALRHHYRVNDHHPEHYADGIHGMGLVQMLEMLCDWIAATRRHDDGDIEASIEKNAERFGFGPEITRLLRNTLADLEVDDMVQTHLLDDAGATPQGEGAPG